MTPSYPHCFFRMNNPIQNYEWGSKTSLNQLFGIDNSDNKPQAEMWMGTHKNGCSRITYKGKEILLSQFIDQAPTQILGDNTVARFAGLPYLFKVLAAEKALSIQVHPNKSMAEKGFQLEEQQGIPLTASNRNYKDANHKPELIYALTDYMALNGFREFNTILSLFKLINIPAIAALVHEFDNNQTEQGLAHFFSALLNLTGATKKTTLHDLICYAEQHSYKPIFALINTLSTQFPGDIGLFAPLLLNIVELKKGQAMFLDASTPHAYIKGTGLEIMANSDNVLRAGLTPKYIDIDELIKNTLFQPKLNDDIIFTPEKKQDITCFNLPIADFQFSIHEPRLICVEQDIVAPKTSLHTQSAEIIFALNDELHLSCSHGDGLTIKAGESAFIPAYVGHYQVQTAGEFARVYN